MKNKPSLSPRIVGIISVVFGVWVLAQLVMEAIGLIVGMFTDSGSLTEWQSVPNVVICALFVTGGLGLIYGKSKGRFLVMAGAILSFLTGVVAIILLSREHLAESISGFIFFSGLLDAGLFYIAWNMTLHTLIDSRSDGLSPSTLSSEEPKPPDTMLPTPAKTSRKIMYDVAYACFGLIGVTLLLITVLDILSYYDYKNEAVFGTFFIVIPLSIMSILAALVGAILSFILRREWPLWLMTILGALLMWVVILDVPGKKSELILGLFTRYDLIVGLVYLVLVLRWWLVIRKKIFWR